MTRINEIDREVIASLSGGEKIKHLLSARGMSLRDVAKKHGEWPESVSACIRGERPLGEIRDILAEELELSREVIDELIDGAPAAPRL